VFDHLAGFAIAVDQTVARHDVGAVMRRALAGAEQQDIAGQGVRWFDLLATLLEAEVHAGLGAIEVPGLRVIKRDRDFADQRQGHATDETDAVAADALE
jgi:hypothetical protein